VNQKIELSEIEKVEDKFELGICE